ncbi:hypothetical protein ACWGBV_12990 [Streptomyces sp. NPDC055051]
MLARPGNSRLDHTGGERLRQNSAPWDLAEDHDNRVRTSLGDATAATVYEHGHLEDLHAHVQDPQGLAKALVNAGDCGAGARGTGGYRDHATAAVLRRG